MKGFELSNGDVVIENGEIQMVSGAELTRQTVETVLGTNKGEWFFNADEGITFSNILGKKGLKETQIPQTTTTIVKTVKEYVDNAELNALLQKRLDGVI